MRNALGEGICGGKGIMWLLMLLSQYAYEAMQCKEGNAVGKGQERRSIKKLDLPRADCVRGYIFRRHQASAPSELPFADPEGGHLVAMMKHLPPKHASAVLCASQHGSPEERLARWLGVPVPTVRTSPTRSM